MTEKSLLAQVRTLLPLTHAKYGDKITLRRAQRAAYTANRTARGVQSKYGTGYEFDAEQKSAIRTLRAPAGSALNAALTVRK